MAPLLKTKSTPSILNIYLPGGLTALLKYKIKDYNHRCNQSVRNSSTVIDVNSTFWSTEKMDKEFKNIVYLSHFLYAAPYMKPTFYRKPNPGNAFDGALRNEILWKKATSAWDTYIYILEWPMGGYIELGTGLLILLGDLEDPRISNTWTVQRHTCPFSWS